jgi:hypothetical protein
MVSAVEGRPYGIPMDRCPDAPIETRRLGSSPGKTQRCLLSDSRRVLSKLGTWSRSFRRDVD